MVENEMQTKIIFDADKVLQLLRILNSIQNLY